MLKLKINTSKSKANWEPFELDDIYLSPNLTYLSGSTDISNNVLDGTEVLIRRSDDDSYTHKVMASVKESTRNGEVHYKSKLKVNTIYTSYIDSSNIPVYVEKDYVTYNDSIYYKYEYSGFSGFFIDGVFYTEQEDGYVYVDTTAYVNGNDVRIGNRDFKVYLIAKETEEVGTLEETTTWVIRYDEDSANLESVNGYGIEIEMYDRPKKVQNITLKKKGNEPIELEDVTCGSYVSFVQYEGKSYQAVPNTETNQYGVWVPSLFGDELEFQALDYDRDVPGQATDDVNIALQITSTTINDVECPVTSMISASDMGSFLILMTKEENRYNEGDLISVESTDKIDTQFVLDEVSGDSGTTYCATIDGNRYYAVAHDYDVVTINDTEYKLNYYGTGITSAYTYINGEKTDFKIVSDKAFLSKPTFLEVTLVDGSGKTRSLTDYLNQSELASSSITEEYGDSATCVSAYTVTTGYGLTYGDEIYRVYETMIKVSDEPEEYEKMYYTVIPHIEEYMLRVNDIAGANMLICKPKTYNSPYPSEYAPDSLEICKAISSAKEYFTFELFDNTFGERKVTPLNYVLETIKPHIPGEGANARPKEPTSSLDVNGIGPNMEFYHEVGYYKVPIKLSNDDYVGVMKDDSVNEFVHDFAYSNVNKIVDMEKIPYRLYANGKPTMTFRLEPLGDLSEILSSLLLRKTDGSVPDNIKGSFFRLSIYDSMNSQTQRLFGTMCLMLGPASIPYSKEIGGLMYEVKPMYVDLGLPSGTKWAKCNIGAEVESEMGEYYMYGKGAKNYQATSGESIYEGTENPLDSSADTATQLWGDLWHTPTKSDFEELKNRTTMGWTTIDGVSGCTFTASNGNYVFFPSSGFYTNGEKSNVDFGFYLSSTPFGQNKNYGVMLINGNASIENFNRDQGYPVRPVTKNTNKTHNKIANAYLTARYNKISSNEGFNLYAFKEYFDGESEIDAYMRIDFNNAKTGQVIPLTYFDDEIPLSKLAQSLYFPITMNYDEDTEIFSYSPKNMEGKTIWEIDENTGDITLKIYQPKLKDESGLEE